MGPSVSDLSSALIAQALQRDRPGQDNVLFQVGDARELLFPDASFDRVIATQVLLHLDGPLVGRGPDAAGPRPWWVAVDRRVGLGQHLPCCH